MNLNIPELGTKLRLSEHWTFNLYEESRNESLWVPLMNRDIKWSYQNPDSRYVSLPKGTILTVDRIYIRKGSSEFSSVSFFIDRASLDESHSPFIKKVKSGKGRCRFWAKLSDVNAIQYEALE